ncbi:leucine-rich repeat domain-containing protein [Candidatus Saccharibacteria bacterium]|nr:leucine-rich repeat domain-containing protein [Candidatus Saccharibacteria bacterium]
MKFGAQKSRNHKKTIFVPVVASILALSIFGIIKSNNQIWADHTNMTRLQFSEALFCQRVSQAVNDSLGNGMADGSDCVNRNLYVSTANIGNIQTLNIVPPEGGFGNFDWDSQDISINGEWVTVFSNLKSLSINNMPVEDISPLRRLTGDLTYIDLSNNRINNAAPLESVKDTLVYLDLSGNPIYEGFHELSEFTKLTTLKLANTGLSGFEELFIPAEPIYDEETGEPIGPIETSSNLAKVLTTFDISENESMSSDKEEKDKENVCTGSLTSLSNYADELVITTLYANNDNLNSDDLICISDLNSLTTLDISHNHIDDFSSIRDKSFTSLTADSQSFIRTTESLDYNPIPQIFTQAGIANYFTSTPSASNTAVSLNALEKNNAQFYNSNVRFINAAIAAESNEHPQPATITIPSGTGVFENSKLEVFFTGQVVTFNDTNLCNRIYNQGSSGYAFIDADGNSVWSLEDNDPVVLTNACNTTKQIALVNNGSSIFARLSLDSINNGAVVDLTGLEEFNNLEVLSLQNNNLSNIRTLESISNLRQLWLNNNNLGNDDWPVLTDFLTNLDILYLNNNHMSEISDEIGNLYRLANLYLVNNGISDVTPLAHATTLSVLDLSENSGISDFSGMAQQDIACNPSILKIENAGITQIPSANTIANGFSNLTSLNLNGNEITNGTIANLASAPRLDELYLSNNQITNTSEFGQITNLKKLFLDNNQITNTNGLTSLTKLAELHLGNNQIDNITGINTLPALATLDITNQTLTGTIEDAEEPYNLPTVFSQAKTLSFPKVSGFQSISNYTVTNGTVDYDEMTATITDTSDPMVITIPDGGLTGTKITLTYEEGEITFAGTITDNTSSNTVITATSSNSFTIESDKACIVLWRQNNSSTYNRLASTVVPGNNNMREYTLDNAAGKEIIVSYAGDINGDGSVNVRDARKVVNSIIGRDSLSNLEAIIADVDGKGSVNIRDARAIINNIMGKAEINW